MSKAKKTAVLRRLAELYRRMDEAYAASAQALGLTCQGCADNCCESVFRHHTYAEWLHLWAGLTALDAARQKAIREAAEDWLRQHQNPALPGIRPRIPCPLSQEAEGGLRCALYAHRPMICRLHGVPNVLTRPGGQQTAFPGCDRGQALAKTCAPLPLDRTPLLTELARLEMDLVGRENLRRLPRVDLTLAEMILAGQPRL